MNIEKTLTEAGNYFKSKVLAGEYEVTEVTEHSIIIKIDNKYEFDMWVSENPEFFRFTDIFYTSLNVNEYFEFTEKEKIVCHSVMAPRLEDFRKQVLKAQKIEQIKKLQQEIEKL